jgi:hypothetical protein
MKDDGLAWLSWVLNGGLISCRFLIYYLLLQLERLAAMFPESFVDVSLLASLPAVEFAWFLVSSA